MATLHPNQMQRRSTELAYKQYKLLSAVCCPVENPARPITQNPKPKPKLGIRITVNPRTAGLILCPLVLPNFKGR